MINEQDVNGNTPLHLATIRRQATIVTAFFCLGVGNLCLENNVGQTAMDIAETNLQSSYKFSERLILLALTWAQKPMFVPFVPRIGNRSAPTATNPDANTYKKLVNTLLVVTTLLVTVTLATAFTIPGGYNSTGENIGMATLAKKTTFQVFIICNTLAMGASVVALVFLLLAQLGDINRVATFVEFALNYLMIALCAMPISFTTGVVLVVSHIPKLSKTIMIIAAVLLSPIPVLLFPFYLQYIVFLLIYVPYRYVKDYFLHQMYLALYILHGVSEPVLRSNRIIV
ncbi:Ankyrin repeat-containing domain [Arabidopsis suecica]|uniref:Ankyrin repeat-containing domain n=1 Tax=Arabidopsis suecica TaxID=45249 RepID=A0A8T1ZCM8_ARASU|nr:Ankyrin repeat-containing domain [Arabidopsis suecica]